MKKKIGMTIGAIAGAIVIGGFGVQQIAASDGGEAAMEQQREISVHNEERNNMTDEVNQDDKRENMNLNQNENHTKSELISAERAKEIALNEFDGTITEFELDEDDGRFIYEIEMRNATAEAEINIDGKTEEILELDNDKEEDDTENNAKSNLISAERAKEIALNEFDGTITEFELDDDEGRFIYEIEMRNATKEAEVAIDGQTEKILELDIDNDEDDDRDDD